MATPQPRPRRWRSRLRKVALWSLAVALVLRIALPLVLPRVLASVLQERGLHARYERLDLSLLGGAATLWNLEVWPSDREGQPAGERLLRVERCEADLDVLELLRGRVSVRTALVDGIDALLERAADGSFPALRHLRAGTAPPDAPSSPSTPAPAAVRAALDLRFPFVVHFARFQNLAIRLRDLGAPTAPERELCVRASLRLSDLGHAERPTLCEASGGLSPDAGTWAASARITAGATEFGIEAAANLGALRLARFARWLAPLGLRPEGESLDGDARATLQLTRAADPQGTWYGELRARAALTSNGLVAAGLDEVHVPVLALDREGVRLGELRVTGSQLAARRASDGSLVLAGLAFVGSAEPARDPGTPPPRQPGSPFRVAAAGARLRGLHFRLFAPELAGAAALHLVLDDVVLSAFDTEDPDPERELSLTILGSLPGSVARLAASVRTRPFATPRRAVAGFEASGIAAEALAPWCAPFGVAPTLQAGTLRAEATLTVADDGNGVHTLRLEGGRAVLADGAELAAWDEFAVGPIRIEAARRALAIEELVVRGLRTSVFRNADGSLETCGVRILPDPPRLRTGAPASRPASAAQDGWRLALRTARVAEAAFEFVDRGRSGTPSVRVEELAAEVADVVWPGPTERPAHFRASARAPGLAEDLRLTGTFAPGRSALACEVDGSVRGRGLTTTRLAPWLRDFGLEPELTRGSAEAAFTVATAEREDGLRLQGHLRDVALHEGERELVGINLCALEDAELDAVRTRLGAVRLLGARLQLSRDRDGVLHAAGFRALPRSEAAASRPTKPATAPRRGEEPARHFELGELAIVAAELAWEDAALASAPKLTLAADARLEGLTVGRPAEPARFALTVHSPTEFAAASCEGTLSADPERLALTVAASGTGLRCVELAKYLPPGVHCELAGASMQAELAIASSPAPNGGRTLAIVGTRCELAPADGDVALLEIPGFAFRAARLDPEAGIHEIESVRADGLSLPVTRDADGTLHLLGLRFAKGSGAPTEARPESRGTQSLPTRGGRPIPRISLGELDVTLGPLTFREAGAAVPLEVRGRAHTTSRIVLLEPEWENLPPLPIRLEGSAIPFCRAVRGDLVIEPFAREPEATLALRAEGLSAAGLLAALPSLARQLEARTLVDGTATARARLGLDWKRKHPLDWNLADGFACELEVKECLLTDRPSGTRLLGLDGLSIECKRIVPSTGEAHVRSIEVRRPSGSVAVERDGLEVAGFLVRTAAAGGPGPASAPAERTRPLPVADAEFRIDEVLFSGLDFEVTDRTTTPTTRLPLTGLDVEVRRFTTRAFTEPLPVRFSAILEGGAVPLTQRANEPRVRPFLEELSLRGAVTLDRQPTGAVRVDLSGLELAAFQPLASRSGITLNDGVLDAGFTVDLLGARGAALDLRSAFRGLSLSEPANGPLQQLLKLPTSIDTVLFALENQDREIKLPLGIMLAPEGIGAGQIAGAVVTTLSGLIARAVAAAPFRVTGALGDLAGLGAEDTRPKSGRVRFAPAEATPRADRLDALEPLLSRLLEEEDTVLVLQHEFGADELARFEEFANPEHPAALAFLHELAERRARLQREHDLLAAVARTEIESGALLGATIARDRLAASAGAIAATEAALDRLAFLVRPDAKRGATRRTREAALEVARLRLEAVREEVVRRGLRDPERRLDLRRPRYEAVADEPRGAVVATVRKRGS